MVRCGQGAGLVRYTNVYILVKYKVFISGQPRPMSRAQGDRPARSSGQAARGGRSASLQMHRFPPVIQVLNETPLSIGSQLQAISLQAFNQGSSLSEICKEVHTYARQLGFAAVLGVQEVYSDSMPSYPEETVMSALIMVDLRPLMAKQGTGQGFGRAV